MRFLSSLMLLSGLVAFASAQNFTSNIGNFFGLGGGDTYDAEEVIGKTPSELLRIRGFGSEIHFAKTKDGYFINVVRIVNNKLPSGPFKRPVIFNHGLLESGTIWLINARNVQPLDIDACGPIPTDPMAFNGTFYLNAPMMLSMRGYDVWIMSMRGTDFSLRHETLSPLGFEFWNYSLDDFALGDVPTVVDYVRRKTGFEKVGYVGHSQATFSVFGLLATRPKYADVIEPVVAVAPVAYAEHMTSLGVPLFVGAEELTGNANARFPPLARAFRRAGRLCDRRLRLGRYVCQLIETLVGGAGKKWLKGYFTHLPFYTSLKVLRHFGQLVQGKRFSRYSEDRDLNLKIYGSTEAPSYQPGRIRSNSLVLISTRSDVLSPVQDVARFRRELAIPPLRDIFIDKDFNHFDMITDGEARSLVNKPMLEVFESFEANNPRCSSTMRFNMREELENSIEEDDNQQQQINTNTVG